MKKKIKEAIEQYQCSGCITGSNISCYTSASDGVGCGSHYAGTGITSIGKIFLGMPKGFNRIGQSPETKIWIYEALNKAKWTPKYNIPCWKYVNEAGHTLVRGLSPRINSPYIHIYLKDCATDINCLEITQEDINEMD